MRCVFMIRWNVAERAERQKGWTNAYQLAKGAGISQPAAARVLAGASLERIEVGTLEKLAAAFGLKTPWSLLDYDQKGVRR
jgi:transcriptional regulator with XRE-family HTH domain